MSLERRELDTDMHRESPCPETPEVASSHQELRGVGAGSPSALEEPVLPGPWSWTRASRTGPHIHNFVVICYSAPEHYSGGGPLPPTPQSIIHLYSVIHHPPISGTVRPILSGLIFGTTTATLRLSVKTVEMRGLVKRKLLPLTEMWPPR